MRKMTPGEAPAQGSGKTGPPEFDTSVPHQARVYDYLLGGKDNYAADREGVDAALKIYPDLAFNARANRAFLGRAVRYLAEDAGMRQFLDIGTGIPTAGNTHEIAQAIAPESRVVYVDYDPIVLAHARALLTSSGAGSTDYIHADLRDTSAILDRARELLDFAQPVAVTLVMVLHAIPDCDDPHAIVARLVDAVPSGSYLAISHPASDLLPPETMQEMESIWGRLGMNTELYPPRDREQVTRFFEGTELVEPGLVRVEEWRPEPASESDDTHSTFVWSAVGRKP